MLDPQYHGPAAAETYIDLLARVGRHADALTAALKVIPKGSQSMGYAPTLLELAEKSGEFRQPCSSIAARKATCWDSRRRSSRDKATRDKATRDKATRDKATRDKATRDKATPSREAD
jgi:hypothetical protein